MGKPRKTNTQSTNAIRTLRLIANYDLRGLAARVGRTSAWLSMVERGVLKPEAKEVEKIAAALGVPVESLRLR